MKIPNLIIIRGAPGVGKTELSKALSPYYQSGVIVEVDILRKMVISVDWKNQNEHINMLGLAAKVTINFLEMGYRPVIVIDTFSGDKINNFMEIIKNYKNDLDIKLFGLFASKEVLAVRIFQRPNGQFKNTEISFKLNSDLTKVKRLGEIQLDTSNDSSQILAAKINALLQVS